MTARAKPVSLRWSFSTLGCAELSLPEICELAEEFDVRGIEVRAASGRMDLHRYCAEEGWTPARIRELCERHHTQLVVAGSSLKLTNAQKTDRADFLEYCEWAESLNIPFVRVFGGGTWGTPLTDEDFLRAYEIVNWWRREKRARNWRLELLMETHDAFSASAPCLKLNERLNEPLLLIWDSHHTWRLGGESPEQTWAQLGPWIRHVHIKDSIDRPSARHPFTYVLPGEGQMPLADVIALLRGKKFAGFVSLEWERLWHPYLPPLRDALARLQQQPWFKIAADETPAPVLTH